MDRNLESDSSKTLSLMWKASVLDRQIKMSGVLGGRWIVDDFYVPFFAYTLV
jgi:hypothetical protein